MNKTHDYEHSFKNWWNSVESVCHVRIFEGEGEQKGATIVVCSQLSDDKRAGVSVTNAAEQIATEVSNKHRIQPNCLVWFEHYAGAKTSAFLKETVDRVFFKLDWHLTRPPIRESVEFKYSSPHWYHSSRETLEKWIGGAL